MRAWHLLAIVAIGEASAMAEPWDTAPAVRAMKDEITRSMDKLELPGFGKPYFISYALWDMQRATVRATFGAITESELYPNRTVDVDLRVGDYAYDNSNVMERDRARSVTLPVEDDYDSIRRSLWLVTDRQYKHAVETLERKKAVAKAETKNPDEAPSFSKEPPSHVVDERAPPTIDQAALETLAKNLSAVFRTNPDVHDGNVTITAASGKQYFVSSEGSASLQASSYVRIDVECRSQADDGMPISDSLTILAERPDQLPPQAELVAQVEKLSHELSAVRAAPVVDDYGGPIVFGGIASAQVVGILLAENFAGTPAPKSDRPGARAVGDSELVGKIGQRILPKGTSVIDDPTSNHVGKLALVGGAHFDEEGIPQQKVSLVENGTLKRFLMSRIPRKGFEHSNGHAASTPYSPVRAHPANLIVSSTKGISDAELRKRALALAQEEDLKYVLFVDKLDVARDQSLPRPAVMRRVYLDGHEELVRGATFGSVTIHTLKDIVAMGSTPTAYSYSPSGYFVSIVAPPLLLRDVDVKKPIGAQRTAPIAPRP